MFKLKLKKGRSYIGYGKKATIEKPFVEVESQEEADTLVATGYFDIISVSEVNTGNGVTGGNGGDGVTGGNASNGVIDGNGGDSDETGLRVKAKELGIQNYHNMKIDNLKVKITEKEAELQTANDSKGGDDGDDGNNGSLDFGENE